ncbi:MAG: HAMP domain-containing histidine kinase [Ignavibacteria bacterium]|jgi:signal transduction histidine kinase|nr:HAMP domain-containing histidine kinase [Ignavibacteria bacterium]
MIKLKNKILFFFFLLIASFSLLITVLVRYYKSNTDSLLLTRKSEKDSIITKILSIERENLIKLVHNFADSKALLSEIKTADNPQMAVNAVKIINSFNIDILWILDNNLIVNRIISNLTGDKITDFPLETSLIRHIISTDKFPHFFVRTNIGLMEVTGYSLQQSGKPNYSTDIRYIFAARIWTDDYIRNLEKITECSISVPQNLSGTVSEKGGNEIISIIQLKGWNNSPVSYLICRSYFGFISEFIKSNRNQRYFAIGIVILIMLAIFTFFYFFIGKPIKLINESLLLHDTSKLVKMANTRSEFGEISRLIIKSNIQRTKILEEIEARKKSEIEQKYFFQKAEEANKLKSFLLANMSHEFRTPLSAIIGFTDILKNEIKDADQQKMLTYIESASERLLKTLVSMLELAQIETTKLKTILQPLDLSTELNSFLENYKFKIEGKSLEFETRIKGKNIIIMGDLSILTLILRNLLDNAVKFTTAGSIKLSIEKTAFENLNYAAIKVEDTGIGIKKEKLAVIFDEFRQVSEGYNRKYEGLGLGLTIAKKLTEILNGQMMVHSIYGKGSVFSVLIPLTEKDLKDGETGSNFSG